MMYIRKKVILWSAVCSVAAVWADVTMPALFSDGMVIQRETKAPVWGLADPGEEILVEASWGAKATGIANADGSWQVKLQTPEAGGPFAITVSGNNTIQIKDVLSGEVWICTGQSNMECNMAFFTKAARNPDDQPAADYIRNEIKTANDPLLRQIKVPQNASPYKKQKDFKGQWISVHPETTGKMTATGYFFARELRKQLKVPVGLVLCAWGGTRVEPWISREAYQAIPEMAVYYDAEMASLKTKSDAYSAEAARKQLASALAKWEANGKKGRKPRLQADPAADKQWPATLHNGMLSAIIPYAIQGAIWYQGESNAKYMTDAYQDRFSTLITSWRNEWNQGDFPFYWAQLASFKAANAEPLEDDGWATICDMQRRCLTLPNTGMAVLNDIGEATDIHPHNKMDAGKRLALWALAKDYGFDLTYSGPLYTGYSIEGNSVLITFDHVGSGLMAGHKNGLEKTVESDEPLKRFQIAGTDREWKWADVEIVGTDTLSVSHPDVPNPTVVRYAWSPNPEGANLYNKEGLPASLFTTE
ncbi:sialate O-acetylesterase [Pontiellaceae bacterium B12219]|nr:sialate O-acetylesterase [Pontiellaceae bacterium B12219]